MNQPATERLSPPHRSGPVPPTRRQRPRTDATRMPLCWAGKGKTREAELFRRVARQLAQHCGGAPNHAQELLIGRIAWMAVHLARMDQRILETGEMSEHTGKQYLAWSNSIARGLQALGLQAAPPPSRTLAQHLAEKAAQRATTGGAAP